MRSIDDIKNEKIEIEQQIELLNRRLSEVNTELMNTIQKTGARQIIVAKRYTGYLSKQVEYEVKLPDGTLKFFRSGLDSDYRRITAIKSLHKWAIRNNYELSIIE